MMAHPTQQNRIVDNSTGKDPYFNTVAGTFQYHADHTDMPNIPVGTSAYKVSYVYTGNIDDSTFKEVPVITSIGTYSDAALVTFKEDPTTTTNTYKIRAFKKPKDINSETIELDVPENWHLPGLYEGVMGWIEKTDNGRSERWERFISEICQKFWYELNGSVNQQAKVSYVGGF
jgi:hypothetical protein